MGSRSFANLTCEASTFSDLQVRCFRPVELCIDTDKVMHGFLNQNCPLFFSETYKSVANILNNNVRCRLSAMILGTLDKKESF